MPLAPAILPFCRYCGHPEPCYCEPLEPERQPRRFVAVSTGGFVQILRHGEVEPAEAAE